MKKRVVMLSGANRGIGLAIAKNLYEAGYYLSLGVRHRAELDVLTKMWDSERIHIEHYDANQNKTAESWVQNTLQKFGQLDALINCAGIFRACGMENFDEAALDEVWAINTKAPVILTHQAWSALKQSGSGRVINIASVLGKLTIPNDFAYGLSKHALLAFTHAVRKAGWDFGIRATAICPGWTNTDMAAGCPYPAEKITQPEDIAKVIATILALPNTASVAEVTVNAECLDLF